MTSEKYEPRKSLSRAPQFQQDQRRLSPKPQVWSSAFRFQGAGFRAWSLDTPPARHKTGHHPKSAGACISIGLLLALTLVLTLDLSRGNLKAAMGGGEEARRGEKVLGGG